MTGLGPSYIKAIVLNSPFSFIAPISCSQFPEIFAHGHLLNYRCVTPNLTLCAPSINRIPSLSDISCPVLSQKAKGEDASMTTFIKIQREVILKSATIHLTQICSGLFVFVHYAQKRKVGSQQTDQQPFLTISIICSHQEPSRAIDNHLQPSGAI